MLQKYLNIKELLILIFLIISLVFDEELNGVYNIKQFGTYNKLTSYFDSLVFSTIKKARFQMFRITPLNSSLYKIESIIREKKIGLNQKEGLSLVKSDDNIYWNIIHLNDSSFIIQNNSTKKYVEIQGRKPKCTKILEFNPKDNETKIENSLKFSLFKLYDEVELKPEYNKYIEDEPVDVVIKYIDLTDPNLKREGIIQTVKDEDHEELRYCLRSIFDNIPWIRKIFILMPNEKVR